MSESQTPGPHFSPWWALLLLPIGLAIGWHVGGLPVPMRKQQVVAAPVASNTASNSVRVTPLRRTSLSDLDAGPQLPDAAPKAKKSVKKEDFPVVSEWTSLQSAMEEAKVTGKPVLIDFNADWCGPCQSMKKEVFEDGARGPAVQTAVIPVSIVDRRREYGSNPAETDNLMQRFEVDVFPTLVVFSVETGKIVKSRGFQGAEATAAWIAEAAKKVR